LNEWSGLYCKRVRVGVLSRARARSEVVKEEELRREEEELRREEEELRREEEELSREEEELRREEEELGRGK
jgi:hypothetical protein